MSKVYGRKNGNVVTVAWDIGTNQPVEFGDYASFPDTAFPLTTSYNEAKGKYGDNLVLYEEPKPVRIIQPGKVVSDEEVAKFMRENRDESASVAQVPVTMVVKPLQQPEQVPNFIDTKFIDDCVKRAIQNEIETYELAQKYASGKKAKEILIIIKALNDFMDRIENGKKD